MHDNVNKDKHHNVNNEHLCKANDEGADGDDDDDDDGADDDAIFAGGKRGGAVAARPREGAQSASTSLDELRAVPC